MHEEIKRKSFEAKISPHLGDLRLTSLWLTKCRPDAEDLVQNALIKAYRIWHPSISRANCRVLLFKILTWIYFDGFQKKSNIPDTQKSRIDIYTIASRNRLTLEQEIPADITKRTIVRLPIELSFVKFLSRLEKFSPKDIAEIIGLKLDAAYSKTYGGNRLLRGELFTYSGEG
jgi:RNA polymerase sigma-70 factor (ECF subfamily)